MSTIPTAPTFVPTASPINYAAIRVAFARTMQASLNLPSNNVVQLQMEDPIAKRPEVPFAAFMLTSLGTAYGQDALQPLGTVEDTFVYSGPRMLTAMFQFYGPNHESAYGLCCAWHSALVQEPTQDMLQALGGLSVWRREAPADISAMLYTGFEGRASFSCSFGVQAISRVTISTIESVPYSGSAMDESGNASISFIAAEET